MREKGGKIKGKKDKARIGKAARTPRVVRIIVYHSC
jgi:hypothetical protein